MATFLEIKQLLVNLFNQNDADIEADEIDDIVASMPSSGNRDAFFTLPNDVLREAYDHLTDYTFDKLAMKGSNTFEIVLRTFGMSRSYYDMEPVNDTVNGITYFVGNASLEYSMFLLNSIVEKMREGNRRIYLDLRRRTRTTMRHSVYVQDNDSVSVFLSVLLKAFTLKIDSRQPQTIEWFKKAAASFEFHFMYKRGDAISEFGDIEDLYSLNASGFRRSYCEIDTPPQRLYNGVVIDYYTMALESQDPFTMYISYYHIIEHYFDAVYRRKLTEEIKSRMTHPDFSYKSDEKIYELAKYINKHMGNDDASGKGNEYESLKYVMMEYVPIEELKCRIAALNPGAVEYYRDNFVPFTTSKKTKIAWADPVGVFATLATRIYETRNALVHSKSENLANQYRPYENKRDLIAEIALIKSVAEMVIIYSSEII